MRPGLWTGFYLVEERDCTLSNLLENIERLKASGFECAELDERNAYALFVSCDEDTAKKNAEVIGSLRFITQVHGPKPVYNSEEQIICEDRILMACNIMHVGTIVMHPFIAKTVEDEPKKESLELLRRFVDKAERYGIKIALENQIYPVDMEYYLSRIPKLCINIDFAHAIAAGCDLIGLIDKSKGRLAGLHVSDSDGRHEDYHIMPGKGLVDWKKIVEHIKNTGYCGDFHLEIVHERSKNFEENDRTSGIAYDIVSRILSEVENG